MKISFLIPSKDRLDLMKQAVASVLDQEGMDLEVIVTDNASAEDYRSYVEGLKDPRITYFRHQSPVSVTENWQSALSFATGDYVLMLGDDDALAPEFFSTIRSHLASSLPDIIYLAAYHYCYPGVLPGAPRGYLASVLNSEFFTGKDDAFDLDPEYARTLAVSVLGFHLRFGMNAQHFLLKSSFIKQFTSSGGLYQSPYPDTFSSVAALVHARTILAIPKESIIIGISPKSFGAYYFSGRHDEGYRFLDNEQVEPAVRRSLDDVILPGDRNNTNWLIAAECVRQAYPSKLKEPVNFPRYRTLQMIGVLRDSCLFGRHDHIAELKAKLSPSELLLFESLESGLGTLPRNKQIRSAFEAISKRLRQYEPAAITNIDIGTHARISDAYLWLKNHKDLMSSRVGRTRRADSRVTRAALRLRLAMGAQLRKFRN